MIEPHCQMTAENVAEHKVVLCGDTTFLDYGSIEAKKKVTAQLVRQGTV